MEEHAKDSIPEEHPKDSIPHVVEIGDETEVMHDPLETSKPSDSKPPRRSEQSEWDRGAIKLKGDVLRKFNQRQLPGDSLASKRYRPRRNYRPFIFVPFTLWIFADTPILTYELSRENNTDTNATDTNTTDTNTTGTEQSCIVGSATRDYYTNKMLCPVLSSHSNLSHTFTWYGVFLATVAIAFLLGLKIEPDDREKHSPVVRFLDCAPAMYTDRHLLGYFVVITLCFLNSVASKRVALMPGSDLYTCLRYGDWQGDEKLCAPGSILEPSAAIATLAFTALSFMTALSDQGGLKRHTMRGLCSCSKTKPEQFYADESQSYDMDVHLASALAVGKDRLTAGAVKLKALVRRQMTFTEEDREQRNSKLADAMLFPVLAFKWAMDGEDDDDSPETAILFYQKGKKLSGRKLETSFEDDLQVVVAQICCPNEVLRAKDQVQLNMLGNTDHSAWQAEQLQFQQFKQDLEQWLSETVPVNIFQEYEFCDVIQSYRKANPVPTDDASKKFSCPAMAHVIFGFLVGFCGFILSCVAPLGDALAWSYYFQDPAGPVAERCKDNDTSLPWNPWCHIARPVPLNRAFFMPKLSGLLLPDGAGIFVCLVLKAVVCGGIGALFAITLNKTVLGIKQGQDALVVLNAILMRWVGDKRISTSHIYAWQRARDSILRNDVTNILDRYENVVIMYSLIALYLTSDATYSIVFWNQPPFPLAVYAMVVFTTGAALCLRQALGCHYAQMDHAKSLQQLKEGTYSVSYGSDVKQQRELIDVLINRITGGDDHQLTMLYVPMNPTFQKTVAGYLALQLIAIIARLTIFPDSGK